MSKHMDTDTKTIMDVLNICQSSYHAGVVDDIRKKLDNGLDVNIGDGIMFRIAARNNNIELINLLLDRGIDLSVMNFYGPRIIVMGENTEIMTLLLDKADDSVRNFINNLIESGHAPEKSRAVYISWCMKKTIHETKQGQTEEKSLTATDIKTKRTKVGRFEAL